MHMKATQSLLQVWNIYEATERNIPEELNLRQNGCESLKPGNENEIVFTCFKNDKKVFKSSKHQEQTQKVCDIWLCFFWHT